METIIYVLKFILCSFFVAAFLFIAIVSTWHLARSRMYYDEKMIEIESLIAKSAVTPENYDIIMRQIAEKDCCLYQNRGRNEKMFMSFCWKFRKENTRRIAEDKNNVSLQFKDS